LNHIFISLDDIYVINRLGEVLQKNIQFLSPAVPAAILFSGYVFYIMAVYSLGLANNSVITMSYFGVIYLWIAYSIYKCDLQLQRVDFLDVIVVLFWCVMGVSFIKLGFPDVSKYYLPLVILPYLVGRLMPIIAIKELVLLIAGFGFFALIICIFRTAEILEHWQSLYGIASTRPILNGSPVNIYVLGLLIGNLMLLKVVFLLSPMAIKLYNRAPSFLLVVILFVPLTSCYIILTGNKTALASVIIISTFFALIAKRVSIKRRLLVILLVISSMFGVFTMMPENLVQFYKLQDVAEFTQALKGKYSGYAKLSADGEDSSLLSENNSLGVRAILWRNSLKMLTENLLLGIGAGESIRLGIKPHSSLVQALVELGFIGGGLLIVFYSLVFFRLIKSLIREQFTSPILWYIMPLLIYYFVYDQLQGSLLSSINSYMLAGIAVSFIVTLCKSNTNVSVSTGN